MSKSFYPYRLYVYGSHGFNNYFLYLHYMNQYKNTHTFLYSPKPSMIDVMTRLYSTLYGLCHLSCNIEKGMSKYNSTTVVNFKIADTTDMLVAFASKGDKTCEQLQGAFDLAKKPVSIIDVTGADAIIPGVELADPDPKKEKIMFNETYGKYVDRNYKAETHTEFAMKFLSDAYRNKDLMEQIINNKDKELVTFSKAEESVKALLYWIYRNQFCILQEDYETIIGGENPDRKKRFTLQEYKHAPECEWVEDGERCAIYTGTGLLLARGYERCLEIFDKKYLEITDADIIKPHIHKSMKSHLFTENEDDFVKISYRTSDTESYPLSYQVANFDGSPFKMGNWYINTDFVSKIKQETEEYMPVRRNEDDVESTAEDGDAEDSDTGTPEDHE